MISKFEFAAEVVSGLRTIRKEKNISFDGNAEIENNFMYHKPKDGQNEKYETLRAKAKEFAYLVDDLCPGGKERTISIRYK